eukprot:CAMPEP_0179115294 /NCGR_PEP_ID=MMETSP0796-20121207/54026_1 /TAXON_ID=73915 /ORGANISM="Pyrodinium bahamense, Strain pbaha01" /LENGTH=52 /DNA_ID=CAMNT_0020813541 /DNA_START=47 /DNA_END=202 /DNA_ORIENTATION=+
MPLSAPVRNRPKNHRRGARLHNLSEQAAYREFHHTRGASLRTTDSTSVMSVA